MASTDARPIPIKNTAFRAVFPILDADGDLVTGATGLDSEVSKDQGTFADCTNEATEIATSSGMYYLDLTSTEMNADCVAVIVKTSSSGAKTTVLVFYPVEAGDIDVDVTAWNGTAVSSPATAGIPEVNVKNINNVSASSVTTVNANQGTTQPVNFTGTGASALAKSDMVDVAGAAVSTSTAQLGVNVVNFGGSAGTFASGRPEVNTTHWKGTAAATVDTAGYPKVTIKSGTGTGEVSLSSGKVILQATQTGVTIPTVTTLTNAPSDSSGVTTLLSRLSATRAGYLDNLSAGAVALEASVQSVLSKLLKYFQLALRKDSAIATDNATELTAINANGGSGGGAFANTTDAQEAIRDNMGTAQTGDAYARLGAPAGASVSADVAAVKSDTAAVLDDTGTSGVVVAAASKTGYRLSSTGVQDIWDALTRALTTASSIGKLLVDNINATISSRLASSSYTAPLDAAGTRSAVGLASANLDTQLTAIDDYIDTEVAAIKAKTDLIPASPAATSDIPSAATIADAVWDEALSGHTTAGSGGKALSDIDTHTDTETGAAAIRAAVGLASANLDTQLAAVQADTDDIQTRLPAALVSGRIDASVGAMAANVVTASAIATDAIGAAELAADAVTEIQSGLATAASIAALNNISQADVRTAVGLASANLDTQLDALPTNAELATALASADDAVIAAIAALNNLSSSAAATAVLTTAMTESYAADGAAPTLAQAIYMIQQRLTEFVISGTTISIKKLDGTTEAATLTLDSATSPTSSTRAT